ncbi:hypothetical protein DN752_21045 [Echinicola strongylocentroti]|uniref:HTTM domain-containing protein n=1 Tax=Echinicola strongylocentroti TaxID=1795355 RepID=A0A2Z4INU7_9BACT|nr:hypothetical protein [Echinicola strongylocentroti]AWW32430.1 hypothetical protein DN752_21045 [Echinicola strongylocentroti]
MKNVLGLVDDFFRGLFNRIESNTSLDNYELGILRIFSGLFCLVYFLPKFGWLSEFSDSYFRPGYFNFTNVFNGFLPDWYFRLSDYLIIGLLVSVSLGIFTRVSLRILSIILIFNYGFQYSFGKVDHLILFPLLFLFLSFTNSGCQIAFIKDRESKFGSLSLAVFSICIVFAFFTAGFEKLFSWIDFDLGTSGVLFWYQYGYLVLDRQYLLANYFSSLHPIIYEVMDYLAVVFELSGVIFLFGTKKSWKIYLLIGSIFHFINTLVLNIPYTHHLIVFSVWLSFPFLKRCNFLFILYLVPLFFEGNLRDAFLWGIMIIFGFLNVFIYHKEVSTPENFKQDVN